MEKELNQTKKIDEEKVIEGKKTGVVTNCVKLNVRKGPTKKSDILCVVPIATELPIEVLPYTNEWYKTVTPSGDAGYVCSEYIAVE